MRSLFESIAFIAWAIPFFIVIEQLVPRRRASIRWGAIVIAIGLLVFNSLLVRQLHFPAQTSDSLARILLAWVLTEVAGYWLHRAMHRVPLLWRIHKLHHVDRPLAWFQSWWIHPLDIALFAIVAAGTTAIAGAPMTAAPAFLLARRAWAILLHANVKWPASWLDHVVTTPVVHHRHHREDLPAANFAPSFSILDRLFGTFAQSPEVRASQSRRGSRSGSPPRR